MTPEERCQGKVRVFGYCLRKPSVTRDGKPYCWQHDPEREDKIRGEKWEKRKQEIAAMEDKADKNIQTRILKERAGLGAPTDELLQTIIDLGGIREMIARLKAGGGDA